MANERKKKKLGKGRHASAIKRNRQNIKRAERNRAARSRMKTAIKKIRTQPTQEVLKTTIPIIDSAVSKGLIPKRRGSRLVSRLTQLVARVP